ncbi:hypothetical protein BDN72DRAFT_964832 [Pluteus cervinus]|uniref:Uncharacterized protein n=1 Tax=Pluteus cervinus TaxID=181527 RepID=A0ACD3A8H1_9AGAR|nr:hypothetical protein BDN72DRAFT_964832 [Pluteus cervinus]
MEPRMLRNHIGHPTYTIQADAPIHRLPPELLSSVFLLQRTPYWSKSMGIPWLTVTQVCRRWRDIAYECATLWSYILALDQFPPHIIEKSLQLSKSAPLDLKLHLFDELVLPLMGEAVSRIRRLHVVLPTRNWEILQTFFASPAPLFESLSLHLPTTTSNPRRLDSLFSGITQRLRHLSISGCGVDFNASFLTNLTILEIRDPEPQFTAPEFLSVLPKFPHLRSLRVSNILELGTDGDPDTYAPIPPNTKIVELSLLDLLSIHGSCYAQDINLLSYLSVPPTTTLLFSSGYPHQYGDPFASIPDLLKVQSSGPHKSGDFAPTKIDISPLYGRLKLHMWNSQKPLCAFKLDFLDDNRRFLISDETASKYLFSVPSLSSITEFSTNCFVTPFAWPIISSCLPQLQRLVVEGGTWVATILQVIINDEKSGGSLPSNWVPIFPRLRSLVVEKTEFDDDCNRYLVPALQRRKEVSCGLVYLRIHDCLGVDERLMESLKEVEMLSFEWSIEIRGDDSEDEDESLEARKEQDDGELDLRDLTTRYEDYYVDTW